MPSAVCQRHGVALDRAELVGTMKRLLACLALCASLSVSAQDDNCTVLGVQELSSLYSELSASIDTIIEALSASAQEKQVVEMAFLDQSNSIYQGSYAADNILFARLLDSIAVGWHPTSFVPLRYGSTSTSRLVIVKYADD